MYHSWSENILNDQAVKCRSFALNKLEQKSKIPSIVSHSSHGMHKGGYSPFNKKDWVMIISDQCV